MASFHQRYHQNPSTPGIIPTTIPPSYRRHHSTNVTTLLPMVSFYRRHHCTDNIIHVPTAPFQRSYHPHAYGIIPPTIPGDDPDNTIMLPTVQSYLRDGISTNDVILLPTSAFDRRPHPSTDGQQTVHTPRPTDKDRTTSTCSCSSFSSSSSSSSSSSCCSTGGEGKFRNTATTSSPTELNACEKHVLIKHYCLFRNNTPPPKRLIGTGVSMAVISEQYDFHGHPWIHGRQWTAMSGSFLPKNAMSCVSSSHKAVRSTHRHAANPVSVLMLHPREIPGTSFVVGH